MNRKLELLYKELPWLRNIKKIREADVVSVEKFGSSDLQLSVGCFVSIASDELYWTSGVFIAQDGTIISPPIEPKKARSIFTHLRYHSTSDMDVTRTIGEALKECRDVNAVRYIVIRSRHGYLTIYKVRKDTQMRDLLAEYEEQQREMKANVEEQLIKEVSQVLGEG